MNVFLELFCFFHDPVDVGNLISGSSVFLKPAWTSGTSQFTYCWSLENFELYFTNVWDECNCVVVWAFFGIAFLWDWDENWLFQSCGHCWVFQICWRTDSWFAEVERGGGWENRLRFTFLLAITLPTQGLAIVKPDSCASGIFPSNSFHCHTGCTFFVCLFEGESRLRQPTCYIIEHLVKRPNFPKGEIQLYQLTHKSYLETYGWLRKNWSSSRPGLLGSQSTGDISRKTNLVLAEGVLKQ